MSSSLGMPKVIVAAREICCKWTCLNVKCYTDGATENNQTAS